MDLEQDSFLHMDPSSQTGSAIPVNARLKIKQVIELSAYVSLAVVLIFFIALLLTIAIFTESPCLYYYKYSPYLLYGICHVAGLFISFIIMTEAKYLKLYEERVYSHSESMSIRRDVFCSFLALYLAAFIFIVIPFSEAFKMDMSDKCSD